MRSKERSFMKNAPFFKKITLMIASFAPSRKAAGLTALCIFGKIPASAQTAPRAERNGDPTMNNAVTSTRSSSAVRKLTYSALYLALAMVLPFLTGQVPKIGSMLCPMHIPALLCGFMCGWPWGLAVGFISPLLRSMIFGMPPVWVAIAMAFEMATYGAIAGLLYRKLPKTGWRIYASLISAMVAGRLVWGLVKFLLAGLQGTEFSLALFLSGAVTTAIPGIILQLILIPILVVVMERTNMALDV